MKPTEVLMSEHDIGRGHVRAMEAALRGRAACERDAIRSSREHALADELADRFGVMKAGHRCGAALSGCCRRAAT